MAGAAGFEPETSISETDVLPTKLHSNNAHPAEYNLVSSTRIYIKYGKLNEEGFEPEV